MKKFFEDHKWGFRGLHIGIAALLVVIGVVGCCILTALGMNASGNETALACGLGVWAMAALPLEVWTWVALGVPMAREGIVADFVGLVLGLLVCVPFVC